MIWDVAGWPLDINIRDLIRSVTKFDYRPLLAGAIGLVLFINQFGGDAWAVWGSRNCSYPQFINQVRNLVPPGARVWGTMTFWFGFYDHPYRTQYTNDLKSFEPDYVILYDNDIWGNRTVTTGRIDPNAAFLQPLRDQLTQLVLKRGSSVGIVSNECYGNIEVFHIGWGK